ncbi:EpsD family peptidyl-prolyl cis-trans isomerase [Methylomonas sp. AM2-LC]|uniref:EpsD family peptidyl-prolyl cis-trans isomerase n=1 Tax=Methylomonas sp. AM2-LC TaxID=3153301 RepID=UPI0032670F56
MKNFISLKLLIALSMLTLAACEQHDKEKGATQVIAKINNDEISIHQLNYVLSHSKNITPENADAAKKKILNNLVDISVLYQQALTDKLDRDPETMLAIEQGKRQILAQATLQKITKNAPKPTENEVQVYYQEHPDLFSAHKTFKLKEVLISKAEGKQTALTEALATNAALDDLLKALDQNRIPYQAKQVTQGAENVPLEQLTTLVGLKEGQYITFDKDNAILVMSVISFTTENVDLAKATPIIEKYLNATQHKQFVENAIKELKVHAKIEFEGEFSSLNADKAEVSPSTVATPQP